MKIRISLILILIICTLAGCIFNNSENICIGIVDDLMSCWRQGYFRSAQRYLAIDSEDSLKPINKIISYRILKTLPYDDHVNILVGVVHSGGAVGRYRARYGFVLKKIKGEWKVTSVRPKGAW